MNEDLVQTLRESRERFSFPPALRPQAEAWAYELLGLLFPHFADSEGCSPDAIEPEVARVESGLKAILESLSQTFPDLPADPVGPFLDSLAELHARLVEDAETMFNGDPAAESLDEVMLVYPGFRAIAVHRIAHSLYQLGIPLLPRLLAEWSHRQTGIDIHPGAQIGRRFFIDHGTGIVIGETTIIGDDVKLYQGVTLGAVSVRKDLAQTKRHPTLEDRVVVYAHATILGGDTVVGRDSLIGGNVWLTSSVPPLSVVTRNSEVRIRSAASVEEALNWII